MHRKFFIQFLTFATLAFGRVVLSQEEPAARAIEAGAAVVEVIDMEAQLVVEDIGVAPAEEPVFAIAAQYIRTECGLARRACKLTPEQLAGLKKLEDRKWLKQELAKPAKPGEMKILQGIGRFLGGGIPVAGEDNGAAAAKRVRKAVDEQIASIVGAEQMEFLSKEKAARSAFRDEALARVLVAALDKEVYANEQQRQDLVRATSKWTKGKNLYWQFYFQNQNYIPSIPNNILREALSKKQTDALEGLNAYNYEMDNIQFQLNGMQELVEFEDVHEVGLVEKPTEKPTEKNEAKDD
jgi:hypothetical protein